MARKLSAATIGLALLLGLGACSLPPIKEPASDVPRARLRILADTNHVEAMASPASDCWGLWPAVPKGSGTILGAGHSPMAFENRSLGMPNPERIGKNRFAEIYVPSGKYFSIDFDSWSGIATCDLAGRFIPEAGKDYEIKFWMDSGMCIMSLAVKMGPGSGMAAGAWMPAHPEWAQSCPEEAIFGKDKSLQNSGTPKFQSKKTIK